MLAFKEWWKSYKQKWSLNKHYAKEGWRAALKWYQSVAAECEKDCTTEKDYKTLYFHLKQVLTNEIGN